MWRDVDTTEDSYIARVHWLRDSRTLAVEALNRAQDRLTLYFANADTGEAARGPDRDVGLVGRRDGRDTFLRDERPLRLVLGRRRFSSSLSLRDRRHDRTPFDRRRLGHHEPRHGGRKEGASSISPVSRSLFANDTSTASPKRADRSSGSPNARARTPRRSRRTRSISTTVSRASPCRVSSPFTTHRERSSSFSTNP